LKRFSEFRVHLGTAEIKATINWFEEDAQLNNKTTYHILVKFPERVAAAPGDAILLRSFSPTTTVAGGKVLQINPPKLKRQAAIWQDYFDILDNGTLPDKIKLFLEYSAKNPYSNEALCSVFFENEQKMRQLLGKLKKQKTLVELDFNGIPHFTLAKNVNALIEQIVFKLDKHAQDKDSAHSYNLNEMINLFADKIGSEAYLKYILDRSAKSAKINFDGLYYSSVKSGAESKSNLLQSEILEVYLAGKFSPPDLATISANLGIPKNQAVGEIQNLLRAKSLISVGGNFYLHKIVFDNFLNFLRDEFKKRVELDIAEVRTFTQSTRKFIIPLMEYTDSQGFTIRDGDIRFKGDLL